MDFFYHAQWMSRTRFLFMLSWSISTGKLTALFFLIITSSLFK